MSTDFDIRCVTCARAGKAWVDRSTSLDNVRSPDSLQSLIDIRDAMTALGRTVGAASFWIGVLDMEVLYTLARFFGEHEGHALEVADEYGHAWMRAQAYDSAGEKVGAATMQRIEETTPRAATQFTMPQETK